MTTLSRPGTPQSHEIIRFRCKYKINILINKLINSYFLFFKEILIEVVK